MNRSDGIWDEIKGIPHLCASEVLVQGLEKHYGREKFDCIGTIDGFMNNLFPDWLSDKNKEIARYQIIVDLLNEVEVENYNEEKVIESFKKNPKGLMEAVRYLMETETPIRDENGKHEFKGVGNGETTLIEQVFINKIVNKLLERRDISFGSVNTEWDSWVPEWDTKKNMARPMLDAFKGIVLDEVRKLYRIEKGEELSGRIREQNENAINWFKDYRNRTDNQQIKTIAQVFDKYIIDSNVKTPNKVVVHGLFRMEPIHLKMFEVLEEKNIEVILLNCYNPEYRRVYSSWDALYRMLLQMPKPYKISEIKVGKEMESSFRPSQVGKAYGALLEGRDYQTNQIAKDNIECDFYEYSSTIQFINQVSTVFDNAKKSVELEGTNIDNTKIISGMNEQFYGVIGTELNDIFTIFYPELFEKKSFMSYPAGQFIYYMHDMWDKEEKQLRLNHKGLVECLNMFDDTASDMYENTRVYIGLERNKEGILIDDVINGVKELKNKIEKTIENTNIPIKKHSIRHFGYCMEPQKYESLINALNILDEFSQTLFNEIKGEGIDEYYLKLLSKIGDFNKYKNWKSFNKQEQELADKIKYRLDETVNMGKVKDIKSIKDSIDFYLGENKGKNINWLVRDFDQIEGDLLLFGNEYKLAFSNAEYMHYALVSNENMLKERKSAMPWPLTENSINNKGIAQILELVREQDQSYRACMFFQGLYYLRPYSRKHKVKVKISYVVNNVNLNDTETKHEEYFVIKELRNLMGKRKFNVISDIDLEVDNTFKPIVSPISIESNRFSEKSLISLCPYKYFYSEALGIEPDIYINNDFQVKKLYQEYIRDRIRLDIARIYKREECPDNWPNDFWKCLEMSWDSIVNQRKDKWEKISKQLMKDIIATKELDEILKYEINNIYMQIQTKKIYPFLSRLPKEWQNDVKNQEKPIDYPKNRESYEAWKYRATQKWNIDDNKLYNDLINEAWDGFTGKDSEGNKEKYKISEYVCDYCPQRQLCLYPYRLSASNLLRKKEDR